MIFLCCSVAGYAFDLFSHEGKKTDCRGLRTFGLKTENLIWCRKVHCAEPDNSCSSTHIPRMIKSSRMRQMVHMDENTNAYRALVW